METSLAEVVLALVAMYGLYRLLAPLRRRIESLILWLLLGEKRVIEVETVDEKKRRKK